MTARRGLRSLARNRGALALLAASMVIAMAGTALLAPERAEAATASITVTVSEDNVVVEGNGFPVRTKGSVTAQALTGLQINRTRTSRSGTLRTTFEFSGAPLVRVSVSVGDVEATWSNPQLDGQPAPGPAPSPEPVVPADAVRLIVGSDFQDVVDANAAGTTYSIAAGVHRLQRVVPKTGDRFIGEPGAVLNGARVLDPGAFVRTATGWAVGGQTQEGQYYQPDPGARMEPGHYAEDRPEELFSNGRRLRKVDTLAEMSRSGTWYFDYAADRIHVFDDPHTLGSIETSVVDHAFSGFAHDVTIENIAVTRYASPGQRGAVDGDDGIGWRILFVDASYNHGAGIRGSRAGVIANSRVTYNGQIGMIVNGRISEGEGRYLPILVESNEIAYNKQLGYLAGWEGGGTKFVKTDRAVFRNNWVHHNYGYGFWFDMDNKGALIESNLVEQNELLGIFYEISKSATIRWNISRDNGQGTAAGEHIGDDGAALFISSSSDVEVYGNALSGSYGWPFLATNRAERYSDPTSSFGHNEVANVYVHHNDMLLVASYVGMKSDSDATFTSKGNRFEANTYRTDGNRWSWGNRFDLSWSQWQSAGMDLTGVVLPPGTPQLPAGATAFARATYGPR